MICQPLADKDDHTGISEQRSKTPDGYVIDSK